MKIPVYRFINGKELCTYFVCKLGGKWVAVAYSEGPLPADHWGLINPVRGIGDDASFIKKREVVVAVAMAEGLSGYNKEMLTATLDLSTGELTPWETYAK